MIYRIRIDLAFINPGVYEGLKGHALGILDKAIVINQGEPDEERGYIQIEQCHHDEDPNLPCELLEEHLVPLSSP